MLPGDLKHVNPGEQISVLWSIIAYLQEGEANVFRICDFLDILFIQPLTKAEFCFPGFPYAENTHQSHPYKE